MASINVDKLSLRELNDLEMRVKKAIAVAKDRDRAEAKMELLALAQKRGFSVGELFGGGGRGGKGGKVAVKYRNKDNPTDTWTGRGRQPKWLAAALKKGSKISDFAI